MYHEKILITYKTRFDDLSPTKQFHFASRLNLLQPSAWSRTKLDSLQDWFFGEGYRLAALGNLKPDTLHLNAAALRLPIMAEHPWLYGYEHQLFQALHANVQYGKDLSAELNSIRRADPESIESLVYNPRALAVLSTYLIDVFYLEQRFMKKNDDALIPLEVLRNALAVYLKTDDRPRLNIYLLTHCIIGETLFYSRSIPLSKSDYYVELTTLLIRQASKTWDDLTLDNKLEVALCLQLANVESQLIQRSIDEADAALDPSLGYITDTKVPHKNSLEWAEHRNVLYLLVTGSS